MIKKIIKKLISISIITIPTISLASFAVVGNDYYDINCMQTYRYNSTKHYRHRNCDIQDTATADDDACIHPELQIN